MDMVVTTVHKLRKVKSEISLNESCMQEMLRMLQFYFLFYFKKSRVIATKFPCHAMNFLNNFIIIK